MTKLRVCEQLLDVRHLSAFFSCNHFSHVDLHLFSFEKMNGSGPKAISVAPFFASASAMPFPSEDEWAGVHFIVISLVRAILSSI